MAKPVKILELDYPMIQFLVNSNIHCCSLLAELFCFVLFCFAFLPIIQNGEEPIPVYWDHEGNGKLSQPLGEKNM